MKLFPIIRYHKTSKLSLEEVRTKFDELLKGNKYVGVWKDNCLYMEKSVMFKNKITPDIKIALHTENDTTKITVENSMPQRFVMIMRILIFLMLLIQIVILYSMISNHEFKIMTFLSFVGAIYIFGAFGYGIFYVSLGWEVDSTRHDLSKLLNDFKYK